jgi:hypothetical protein
LIPGDEADFNDCLDADFYNGIERALFTASRYFSSVLTKIGFMPYCKWGSSDGARLTLLGPLAMDRLLRLKFPGERGSDILKLL